MSLIDGNTALENISAKIYRDIVNELNINSAWKIIAQYMVERLKLFSPSWIHSLEGATNVIQGRQSPAELLLDELKIKMCTVKTLRRILEECELLDVLFILQGQVETLRIEEPTYDRTTCTPYKVGIGEIFSISCKAKGLPPPKYQWFHENVELCNQTSSTLSIPITTPDQEGEYWCKVSQYGRDAELFYEKNILCAVLEIKSVHVTIIKEPASLIEVVVNNNLIINCWATGHPMPQYQWYKGNEELKGETSHILHINNCRQEDSGKYRCLASNKVSYAYTKESTVKVDFPRRKALAKIALLIANSHYENHENLYTPQNDAALIAERLSEIGFYVICLKDLSLIEMHNAINIFSKALIPDVYGLFYFVGHGFHMESHYMMPVDSPKLFVSSDTISMDDLLVPTLKHKPALLIVILDMCLTLPDKKNNPGIFKEPRRVKNIKNIENLFIAWSTCFCQPSYELEGANNGIYAMQLEKHIASDSPVMDVFNDVVQSVCAKTTKKQKPSFYNRVTGRFHLTDALIYQESENPNIAKFKKLTTFTEKSFQILFQNNVSCQVTIKPLFPFYLNAIRIITSGLENWEVNFYTCLPNGELKDHPIKKEKCCLFGCLLDNVQRKDPKEVLMIKIGKAKNINDLQFFEYMNYIPAILKKLNR